MKILWNLLYQYNNIYIYKKKLQMKGFKKIAIVTVVTVPLGTVSTVQK